MVIVGTAGHTVGCGKIVGIGSEGREIGKLASASRFSLRKGSEMGKGEGVKVTASPRHSRLVAEKIVVEAVLVATGALFVMVVITLEDY